MRHSILIASLSVALTASAGADPPVELRYRGAAGGVESYRLRIEASVPGEGEILATADIVQEIAEVTPGGIRARARQTVTGTNFGTDTNESSYRIGPRGEISELASKHLDHPVHGAAIRDVGLFYLPLPEEPAKVDTTWSGRRTLYIPDPGLPFEIPPIDLEIVCRLRGFEGPPGSRVAQVEVIAGPAPGQSITAELLGGFKFELSRGRMVWGRLEGEISLELLVIPVTIPISVSMSAGPAPGPASR